METSKPMLDKGENAKQRVIEMYNEIERFLKSDAYGEDLKIELEKSNPGFIKNIKKRKQDMMESDHGIVIAGETSAGKSTLINKILQKNIFKGNTVESTSTICKIRNLDAVKIETKSKDGSIVNIDLPGKCDMSEESGVEMLRAVLTELTDMTMSPGSVNFEYVDVGFPIPFLKGNSILVDTPGIGGSGEVTKKLMDYLPSAVSFVFVINVGSAGGLQTDRLPVILKSLHDMQIKNEMPCFDPKDVIFLTNKWDTIDSQYDVEKEKEELWQDINKDLKRKWAHVREENVFRMNITHVYSKKDNGNTSTKEFERFQDVLLANVEKAKNIRVERHLGFLKELLKNVSSGLNARLQLREISVETQQELVKFQLQRLKQLTDQCKEKYTSVKKSIDEAINQVTKKCYEKMETKDEKLRILNPVGKIPIMEVPWTKSFLGEIHNRMTLYLENFLKSEEVTRLFEEIKNGNVTFYKNASKDISKMEAQWTSGHRGKSHASDIDEVDDLPLYLEIPLVIVAVVLTVIAAAIALVLSPILVPILYAFYSAEKKKALKKKFINTTYSAYMKTIKSQIKDHLNKSSGDALKLLSDRMFNHSLPNRIHHLEELIQNLERSREEILVNMESFRDLAKKVETMKMSALKL